MKFGFGLATAVLAVIQFTTPAYGTQRPLGSVSGAGETTTPVFEGWYENTDGTYSISFGYFNRNFKQHLEIPLGPNNFIEPAQFDGMQPTFLAPRRHWGVFVINVPADHEGEVVWTLRNSGKSFTIPGSLHRDWQIDALAGEAGSGNTPPVIWFEALGAKGAGPAGVTTGPIHTTVGHPVEVTVWARDDGNTSGNVANAGETNIPVTLTWFKHQGPGQASFSPDTAKVDIDSGSMMTVVTFSEPGEYVLRVRANDASGVSGAGHAQCCWTNGFVRITVTR